VGRRRFRTAGIAGALVAGVGLVAATVAIPTLLLVRATEETLDRWAQVGQAVAVVGVFFSGVAFVGIAFALLMQQRELSNQKNELDILRDEQRRSSEVSLRQLHMDIIKMAINDRDLLSVWPATAPGATRRKKDQYCNLILNLQKVAYETGTIERDELRGALNFLMHSRDMYSFWRRARASRLAVTEGDPGEDSFTAEVDAAFHAADPPGRSSLLRLFERGGGRRPR